MKRNILKIWAYLALVSINSLANAGTGQAFFETLSNKYASLSDRYASMDFAKIKNALVTAFSSNVSDDIGESIVDSTLQATEKSSLISVPGEASTPGMPAEAIRTPSQTIHEPIQVPAPTSTPGAPTGPNSLISTQAASKKIEPPKISGLFARIKKNFNSLSDWLGDCIPSSQTLLKSALFGITATNTYQRYCQVKTAYNNNNIRQFPRLCFWTAVSAAGTLMTNDACREKAGPLLSTILMGATAYDIIRQKWNISVVNKVSSNCLIKTAPDGVEQNVKCASCGELMFNAKGVNFNNVDLKQYGDGNETVYFTASGNSITGNTGNRHGIVFCETCMQRSIGI